MTQQPDRRMNREYSMAEFADKLDESTNRLSSDIDRVNVSLGSDIKRVEDSVKSLANRVAYSDTSELKLQAIEVRIAASEARMADGIDSANTTAGQALIAAKWAIGVLVAILSTLVYVAYQATGAV